LLAKGAGGPTAAQGLKNSRPKGRPGKIKGKAHGGGAGRLPWRNWEAESPPTPLKADAGGPKARGSPGEARKSATAEGPANNSGLELARQLKRSKKARWPAGPLVDAAVCPWAAIAAPRDTRKRKTKVGLEILGEGRELAGFASLKGFGRDRRAPGTGRLVEAGTQSIVGR